jgi:multidrug resistance efflux pump
MLVLVAGACGRAAARTDAGAAPGPEDLVVRRGTFTRRLVLTGELKAGRAAAITVPRTNEWEVQIKWLEKDGTPVKVGERVVEFDSSPFTSGLEEKRLAALRARRELEQEQAQTDGQLAEKRFAVEKCRIALEKAHVDAAVLEELLSRREFQERQLKLEKARVELEKATDLLDAARTSAKAGLAIRRIARETANREVRVAEEAITTLVVMAPRDGIFQVAEHPWEGRRFQTGDTVWVGLAVALIPEPSSLMVEAALVDVDDGLAAAGMPVTCTLDTYPESTYKGKVLAVSPVAQEPARGSQRRAFRVDVGLEAVDVERMRAGMSVKIVVEAERRAGVLLAPRTALDLGGDTPHAFLQNGRAAAITLGPCSAQECVVLTGLAEGTRLAVRRGGAM